MAVTSLLQAKKHLTAEDIARRFKISVRTVFRDLRALEEIGVPISFEPGKGYFIVKGYFLPPVSLSIEEVNALALMEPIVLRFADRSIHEHFETALAKIKLVLSREQRENLEKTQSRTTHYLPEAYTHLLPDTEYLAIIQQAINNKTILRIEYENRDGDTTKREIEPIGLTFYSLNWHLIAWCHLRNDYRDFRVSRIERLTPTIMPFRKSEHISIQEYLRQIDISSEFH